MTPIPNPFWYGSPVTGVNFAGRKVELHALVERMLHGINVSVVSPRRYGKTSLLITGEAALRRARVPVVHVNVLANPDPARFSSALATGFARTQKNLLRRGATALGELRRRFQVVPAVEVGDDGKPKLTFAPTLVAPDALSVLEDTYRLLSAGERKGVLVLDELDSILDVAPKAADVLKGLADTYPGVSLVVAGSRRRMMERLVHVHGAPLYGMTQPIALGPIDASTMTRHLTRRAATGGKQMSPSVAARIVKQAGPVPNDIQHLAFAAYSVAEDGIGDDDVDAGLAREVALNDATYADAWHGRSPVQRRVLRALAIEPSAEPFGRHFSRRTGLGPSSIQRAVAALADDEWVDASDGHWHLTDPFLARWVADLDGATT